MQLNPNNITASVRTNQAYLADLAQKAGVSDLNNLMAELEGQIESAKTATVELTDQHLAVKFTEAITRVQAVEGDLATVQEFLGMSFDFTSSDGLIIRRAGSDFFMKLSEQELGFYQGEQKVAYINNSRLYITSAQITSSLGIGKFAWIVESNSSISLAYQ